MSAETGLARFDTRRAAQIDENSEQTDLRTIGAREHGQLALDEVEIESGATSTENKASPDTLKTTSKAALVCARVTIDGLREQVAQLEAERDRLREEAETETEGDR